MRRAVVALCAHQVGVGAGVGKGQPINHVPRPPKNPLFVKFAHVYMTKIPTGIREFVFMGPLCLGAFLLVYFMDRLIPEGMKSEMGGDEQRDMLTYRMEPIHDPATGRLIAYRRVATNKDAADPTERAT